MSTRVRASLCNTRAQFIYAIILVLLQTVLTRCTPVKLPHLQLKSSNAIKDFLLQHGIIPEGIKEEPRYLCEVRYTRDCYVNLGNKIDPAKLQRQPRQVFWPSSNDTYYTLVFLDLDVPSRANPIYRDRQHWVVGNIPGNRCEQGDTLTEYLGPVAPRNSGLHRYIYLVYQQPEKLVFDENRITEEDRESSRRSCYSIEKFVDKYNLGKPYAANFFLSGWPLDQE